MHMVYFSHSKGNGQPTRAERKSLMNELRMNIKMMILSYEEALHNNEAMFSAEESGFRARADKLAKEIYPEFDAEFYHRYADNADWPDDEDEEEFFDDCPELCKLYRRVVYADNYRVFRQLALV